MNGITTNLGLTNSIELFLSHYKYGNNYEDSTVLVDPSYNIIAFYDRGTANIDTIHASDVPFKGGWIIGNDKKINTKSNIKYEPYDYEMAIKQNAVELNRLKQKGEQEKLKLFYSNIKKGIEEYNKNYFKTLGLKLIKEQR